MFERKKISWLKNNVELSKIPGEGHPLLVGDLEGGQTLFGPAKRCKVYLWALSLFVCYGNGIFLGSLMRKFDKVSAS